ncbi:MULTISPECIES: EF-hand domain-containing protein [unclassified Pseudoalteromonas]|uniref:EF-hand domain-containing protein n=1 Tax=unclassified Pseudoalteromonas TaxID=194690 RepID=UPI0030146FC9
MKNLSILIATAALSLSSTAAFAKADFAKYDLDGNGTISIKEAQVDEALVEQFNDLDSNADGVLSKSEFAKY